MKTYVLIHAEENSYQVFLVSHDRSKLETKKKELEAKEELAIIYEREYYDNKSKKFNEMYPDLKNSDGSEWFEFTFDYCYYNPLDKELSRKYLSLDIVEVEFV